MSAFRDSIVTITLADKEYPLLLNLLALDVIQDKYKSIGDLFNTLNENETGENIKILTFLLSLLIEEGSNGQTILAPKDVARMIPVRETYYVMDKVKECFNVALAGVKAPAEQEEAGDEEKNAPTATSE